MVVWQVDGGKTAVWRGVKMILGEGVGGLRR